MAETREVARKWRRSMWQWIASGCVLATGEGLLLFPLLTFVVIGTEVEGIVGVVVFVLIIILVEVVIVVLIGEEIVVFIVIREEFGVEIVLILLVIIQIVFVVLVAVRRGVSKVGGLEGALGFDFGEGMGDIFDGVPDFAGDEDGGGGVGGEGDAVAGAGVDFDQLASVQLIFGGEDEAGMEDAAFEVVDDDAVDFGSESEEQVADEVVSEGAFFGNAAHEHGDGGADAFVDVNDKDLFFSAEEHGEAAFERKDGAHPDFDDVIVHDGS